MEAKTTTINAEEPVKMFLWSAIDETYSSLASELQISTRTLQKYKNGEEIFDINNENSKKRVQSLIIKAYTRKISDIHESSLSDKAWALRRATLRAQNIDDLSRDAYEYERRISNYHQDWGILHIIAVANFIWFIYQTWKYSKNKETTPDLSKLEKANSFWKEALKISSSLIKPYIQHNITTSDFLLKLYSKKHPITGKLTFEHNRRAELFAEKRFFDEFTTSAESLSSIHAWRDAVEMGGYLREKDSSLFEQALKGFIKCVEGKSLSSKGRHTCLDILQNIDNNEFLDEYKAYHQFVKSVFKA